MNFSLSLGSQRENLNEMSSRSGCYERTLALLIEKYGGAFPLWLSPEQVRVLSKTPSLNYIVIVYLIALVSISSIIVLRKSS